MMKNEGEFYRFDPDRILPGDILLSAVQDGKNSKAIRFVTKSDFSHVAMCSEHGFIVEAVGTGLRRVNLRRIGVRDLSNISLMRLGNTTENFQAIASAAAKEVQLYVTRNYWISGALTSILNVRKVKNTTSFFCSHLVAHAYQSAGFDLVADISPENVTPEAISNSPALVEVKDQIVFKQAPVSWMWWDLIDEESSYETPHQWEVNAIRTIHRKASIVLRHYGIDPPPDFILTIKLLVSIADTSIAKILDDTLYDLMVAEGLVNFDVSDFPTLKEALVLDVNLMYELEQGSLSHHDIRSLRDFYADMQVHMPNELREREASYRVFKQINDLKQYKATGVLVDIHEAMLFHQIELMNVVERAMDILGKYCRK